MYSKLTIEQLRNYYQKGDASTLEEAPQLDNIDETKKKLLLENLKIKKNENEYTALQEKLCTQEVKEVEYKVEKDFITGLIRVTTYTDIR